MTKSFRKTKFWCKNSNFYKNKQTADNVNNQLVKSKQTADNVNKKVNKQLKIKNLNSNFWQKSHDFSMFLLEN